jgi:hypothetical protein
MGKKSGLVESAVEEKSPSANAATQEAPVVETSTQEVPVVKNQSTGYPSRDFKNRFING